MLYETWTHPPTSIGNLGFFFFAKPLRRNWKSVSMCCILNYWVTCQTRYSLTMWGLSQCHLMNIGDHLSGHSPEEISLLRLTEIADSDVRQHLLLKNLPSVLDSLLLRHTRARSTRPDEVERDVLLLYDEGLVEGGLHLYEGQTEN